MVGFYNYTVILTYIGLISGTMGIFFAVNDDPVIAVICLIVSGVCDMFDGKIARTMKRNDDEEKFGIQIDSLSDLICFGVLPTAICFNLGFTDWYYFILYGLFILCGLIRLAYFNVLAEKENDQEEKCYYGLPITTTAIVFPIIFLFTRYFDVARYVYLAFIIIIGILFVIKFRLKKPKLSTIIIFSIIAAIGIGVLIYLGITNTFIN